MKHLFTTAACLAMSIVAFAAPTQLSYQFKNGKPSDITTKNYSSGQLESTSYNASKYNLVPGWSVIKITDEDAVELNGVQAFTSCSRLNNNVTPDNWLILPALNVTEGANLEWTAKSISNGFKDSYDVYISTSGTEKSDFTPVYHVEKEDYFYARHIISLNKYVGKDVRIAFVHSDPDGYMLAIGEVYAGFKNRGFHAKNIGTHYFGRNDEQVLNFEVTNFGGKNNTTIKKFEIVDSQDPSIVYSSAEPTDLAEVAETFKVSFPLNLEVGTFTEYILRAEYENGTTEDVISDFVNVSEFKRKVFVEKYTGTWCNNCPAVAYVTHYYLHKLGNDAIYLEPHVQNAAKAESLALDTYVGPYQYSLGGDFPAVWINRQYRQNTNNVRDHSCFEKGIMEGCFASVKLDVKSYDYKTVKARATVISSEDLDNTDGYYRVAFNLAQKEVFLKEGSFQQTNRVSGLTSIVNGEYNFMPTKIPYSLSKYENVVIGPENGFRGDDGTLPAQIKAGEPYTVEFEFEIPETADAENLILIANFNYHKENKGSVPFPSLNVDFTDLEYVDCPEESLTFITTPKPQEGEIVSNIVSELDSVIMFLPNATMDQISLNPDMEEPYITDKDNKVLSEYMVELELSETPQTESERTIRYADEDGKGLYLTAHIIPSIKDQGIYTLNVPEGLFLGEDGSKSPLYTREFEVNPMVSVDGISVNESLVNVYSIDGVCIAKDLNVNNLNELPKGLYIAKGRKIIIK